MLGSVLLVGWALAGQADLPADEALKLEVRRLVRQLGADQLAERNAAEQAMVKLGPKILDLLPRGGAQAPEVQQRLQNVRQSLQRAAAESAAKPSLVTLHGGAVPLLKVLAAIAEQSGNPIVDYRERFGHPVTDPPLKVDFDKTPFWPALDQVLDQAGLTVYAFGEQRAVHVVGRSEGQLPRAGRACYSGPFRFEPVQVTAQRELRDPAEGSLRLNLEVAWEPRLKPISLKQRLGELKAVDENGNSLAIDDEQAELEVPVAESSACKLLLPLKLPPRSVKEIAAIKGTLMAMIPGKVETFGFDNLLTAKNVQQRAAGVTITLDRVQKNNQLWQVWMRVQFDQPDKALESHRGWILQNEAYLEDPDGKRVDFFASEPTRQTQNELGMAYLFGLKEPPAKHKFVYKTPGVIMVAGFDYELKSIKLP